MSNNKLTTQAYTLSRLRNSGYNVFKLESLNYTPEDNRKWTLLIDSGHSNVFMTCYKDGRFSFYDGGQFFKGTIKLDTDSIEVVYDFLNSNGIQNKHPSYGTDEWLDNRYRNDPLQLQTQLE
jgi:hypothetical protein